MNGSESRGSVVAARRHEEKEAGQLELPETSVLREIRYVNHVSGDK